MERALRKATERLGYKEMKPEQEELVKEFISGRDVFGILPTGFGKSLCYGCLPLVFDELLGTENKSIVVVVTPLKAIMYDQVHKFNSKGLACEYISREHSSHNIQRKVAEGRYQLVFITPEFLLENRRWRSIICSEIYLQCLKGFVVDEAHTVITWGDTFRQLLHRIGEIRSILPPFIKVMALTATATKSLRLSISRVIGLKNPYILAICPSKKNLIYSVQSMNSIEETFTCLVDKLATERALMPRTLIYCRTFEECSDIYLLFRRILGENFTDPLNAPDLPQFRLMDMFTSVTDEDIKETIISKFTRESNLRIVVATMAFGMGLDCPDVRQVIHVGIPETKETYIQEVGRAGRDGLPALATLLITPRRWKVNHDMFEYARNDSKCRRDELFTDVDSYCHEDMGTKCLCCDICFKLCDCGLCESKLSKFTFF